MKGFFVAAAGVAGLALAGAGMAVPAPAQTAPRAYSANCQACHQAGGQGTPGVFPRLTGRVDPIAKNVDGRKWLIATVLYGQSGKITVDGRPIGGMMAPFARMPDQDIADALTWLAQGKGKPFSAAEVKAVRGGAKMTAAQVGQERARLERAGVIK